MVPRRPKRRTGPVPRDKLENARDYLPLAPPRPLSRASTMAWARGNVDLEKAAHHAHRVFRGRRQALHLAERLQQLETRFREELAGEHLAIRRIVASPAGFDQLQLGVQLLDALRRQPALEPAARISAQEHQMRHILRVAYRV